MKKHAFLTSKLLMAACAVCFNIVVANAEVVVIVHPTNNAVLDKADVKNLFTGRTKEFPSGAKAIPVELDTGKTRSEFLAKVLGKTEGELQAYWSRMLFTGKGNPPKVIHEETSLKNMVAKDPNLIGFIDASNVDDSVKVVKLP